MFTRIKLTNFVTFASLDWVDHAAMNVIIGENDTGKSHLLKLLYVIGRSINEFQKVQVGPLPKSWLRCFVDKLTWTFQPEDFDLQNLIRSGQQNLVIESNIGGGYVEFKEEKVNKELEINASFHSNFHYIFHEVGSIGRTIFIPPKEILTAMQAIEATRKRVEVIGFDDTYLDLIEDFRSPLTFGVVDSLLKEIQAKVQIILSGGKIIEKSSDFVFKRGKEEYSMAQTAEGFKKIGTLSRLILNRSLTKGSILLVDEPEANLHPKAIIAMADVLFDLSQAGVQVYAATHSFYFLKRIEQRARKAMDVKTSLVDLRRLDGDVSATFHDLREEIPDNPIFTQSEYLLNEDLRLDWEA